MSKTMFFTADEVAEQLGISKPMAYKIIRKMNEELAKQGFITIAGKVSKQYFSEKIYGMKGA
ncbi:transcriptional regulator [Eisenbergiella tayi]|uniref:transcriptional regulator n=1 Tax=Eisenbergiella tayi TaxID=1432052 RepID=UPI000848FB4C|nr:transcriptional regulator [Eisenbergiella tayi]ODR36228.1 transcriptional regulator [Eisenbergiella tayi]